MNDNISSNSCIKTVSFNCHGFKNSRIDLQRLCETYDIILLQETWLPKQELGLLNALHEDFVSYGSSPIDLQSGPLIGRPYGGVAILYRKSIAHAVTCLESVNDRIISITISNAVGGSCILSSVYMPFFSNENFDNYIECLAELKNICDSSHSSMCIFGGDFNANLGTPFHTLIENFCADENLCIFDEKYLDHDDNVFTFLSDAHGSSSWLDHILCSRNAEPLLKNVAILYEFISSDHFPVAFDIVITPYTS